MIINKKNFIYLISPNKIQKSFYDDLSEVLKLKKVAFFQLRLKDLSLNKRLNIGFDKNVNRQNDIYYNLDTSYLRDNLP